MPGGGVSLRPRPGNGAAAAPPHPLELRQDSPRGAGKVVALAGNREPVAKQLCRRDPRPGPACAVRLPGGVSTRVLVGRGGSSVRNALQEVIFIKVT